jgi:hypothetical protein
MQLIADAEHNARRGSKDSLAFPVKCVIGTKADLLAKQQLTLADLQFLDTQRIECFEVSALTNTNVQHAFSSLFANMLKQFPGVGEQFDVRSKQIAESKPQKRKHTRQETEDQPGGLYGIFAKLTGNHEPAMISSDDDSAVIRPNKSRLDQRKTPGQPRST